MVVMCAMLAKRMHNNNLPIFVCRERPPVAFRSERQERVFPRKRNATEGVPYRMVKAGISVTYFLSHRLSERSETASMSSVRIPP